jgi:hypothetical protein
MKLFRNYLTNNRINHSFNTSLTHKSSITAGVLANKGKQKKE